MALITVKDASFAYEATVAVHSLNFEVNAGNYLCIIGENGSGKSTLIKGLLGLLNPASGSVRFGDGLKQSEIGYVAQQTVVQKDFPASCYEVILSGRLSKRGILPFYSKTDKKLAEENLRLLDITNLRNKCYRELSGGQQQRVMLARALCATSKILLVDEPVSGLDPVATSELYSLIYKLNTEQKVTIIMVSHDLTGCFKYATHVLQLSGKQLFFGNIIDYKLSETGKRFLNGGSLYA
jgi:zinc transport system ATP-binding protein